MSKNWNDIYSWGRTTSSYESGYRAGRGYRSARYWNYGSATNSTPIVGFRPVLEVLSPGTLGSVTLDLGGGTLGGSSDAIHIIVKTGSKFTRACIQQPDPSGRKYEQLLHGLAATASSTRPVPTFRRKLPSSRRSLLYQKQFTPYPRRQILF